VVLYPRPLPIRAKVGIREYTRGLRISAKFHRFIASPLRGKKFTAFSTSTFYGSASRGAETMLTAMHIYKPSPNGIIKLFLSSNGLKAKSRSQNNVTVQKAVTYKQTQTPNSPGGDEVSAPPYSARWYSRSVSFLYVRKRFVIRGIVSSLWR